MVFTKYSILLCLVFHGMGWSLIVAFPAHNRLPFVYEWTLPSKLIQ